MAEILSVKRGDQFGSIGTATLEVVDIWCEFNQEDQRWETSVAWDAKGLPPGTQRFSAKGRDFIKTLRDGNLVRLNGEKVKESPSFSTTTVQTSSSVTTGVVVDPKRKMWEDDFRRHATKYGLSPSDLGRKVRLGRRRCFTIIGAKPRNWKMPILVKGPRGGVYKLPAEKVKAGLV
jgi:hypothetical protein